MFAINCIVICSKLAVDVWTYKEGDFWLDHTSLGFFWKSQISLEKVPNSWCWFGREAKIPRYGLHGILLQLQHSLNVWHWLHVTLHVVKLWKPGEKRLKAAHWTSLVVFAESQTTLEKALWVTGKAWRQRQTSAEVSEQPLFDFGLCCLWLCYCKICSFLLRQTKSEKGNFIGVECD